MDSFGSHFKLPGVTFGGLWRSFWLLWGALGVLWVSKGAPGSPLGASGPISGIFREILGALLASILLLFTGFFGYFSHAVF